VKVAQQVDAGDYAGYYVGINVGYDYIAHDTV
jgi:hypothetical protein